MSRFNDKEYEYYLNWLRKIDYEPYKVRMVEHDSNASREYKQAAWDWLVEKGLAHGREQDYRDKEDTYQPGAECRCESLLWGHVNACPLNRKI